MPSPPQTTSASTPSATHWRARSSASSRVAALRGCAPPARPRAAGRARRRGRGRPCPCPRWGWSGARSRATCRPRGARLAVAPRVATGAAVADPIAQPRGVPRRAGARPPWPAGSARRARRPAVNAVPGTASVSRSVERRPAGSAPCRQAWCARSRSGVVGHRRRVGLVDGEQVAGHRVVRPASARSARPARGARCRTPDSGVQVTSDSPSQSGRSNGSRSRQRRRGRCIAPLTAATARRRPTASVLSAPRLAAPVDDPGDDLGDDEQHQHRERQHQHRERVGRRRRDRGEDEGADDDPRAGSAPAACRRPRRRG